MKFVVKFSRLPTEISRAPITGSYWGKKRDKIIALQEYNAKARAALSWKFELEFDGARWISALGRAIHTPSLPLYRCIVVSRGENRSARFSSPFLFRAPNASTTNAATKRKRSARDGNGAAKEQSGTHIPGLREETNQVINWREKRRKGGGGASRVEEKPMSPGQID